METRKIEISQKTILFAFGIIFAVWVLYQVRSILVLIFISFILMTAVAPIIRLTHKVKIPTILVMLVIYIGILSLIGTVVASLIPAVIQQSKGLIIVFPTYLHNLEIIFNTNFDPNVISNYLNSVPSNLLKLAVNVFSNVVGILAVFFMAYYLTIDRPNLHKYLAKLFPDGNKETKAEALILNIEKGVGGWVRGELLLMFIIGVMTYFGLVILGVPYALPLAVIAGLLEAVPNIGPIIAAIPALLIGLTISPVTALGTVILATIIQQLENNIIVPKIMQSATGTKPLVTVIVLLVGFTIGGIAGAVLAMPIYLTVKIVIKAFSPATAGRS